jgi:hypothetical protein
MVHKLGLFVKQPRLPLSLGDPKESPAGGHDIYGLRRVVVPEHAAKLPATGNEAGGRKLTQGGP